jgi:large subunit ribosomal protein L5
MSKPKNLLLRYNQKIVPTLVEKFSLANKAAAPKPVKVVINVGVRSDIKDGKVVDYISEDLKVITGQQPVKTRARKSISSFKVRENQVVGLMVTLRGKRMYEFLDKLFNVTLARVRDFRGLDQKGFDKNGNYSIGLKDQVPFPEISAEAVKHYFGLEITIVTNAQSSDKAQELLKLMGLPIKKQVITA